MLNITDIRERERDIEIMTYVVRTVMSKVKKTNNGVMMRAKNDRGLHTFLVKA